MPQILNPWRSSADKLEYYNLDKELYRNSDYAAYREFSNSVIYTFQNIAVSNLVGFKKDLVDLLASEVRPTHKFNSETFFFDNAMTHKQTGLNLIQSHKPA